MSLRLGSSVAGFVPGSDG